MIEITDNRIIDQVSSAYSYLGHMCISEGNVEAIKFLYGNSYNGQAAAIKTINLLHDSLTLKNIHDDTSEKYSDEFLYYWGMACIGNASNLITKNLDTATICFEKTINTIPKSKARLAFIELLKSTEPHKSINNSRRLGVLREWAGKQDYFSMISLAKIVYSAFLDEKESDSTDELPLLALRLLETPIKKGHPEAIRFYDDIIGNTTCIDTFGIKCSNLNDFRFSIDVLFDY